MAWLSEIGTLVAGLSTAALAVAAWFGLGSWRSQEKTKIKIRFLDELTDVAYEYFDGMSPLVSALEFSEIGVQAHSETEALNGNTGEFAGFRKYVEERGLDDGKRMDSYLEKIGPIKARLNLLSIKGQVLDFPKYQECQEASDMLLSSSNQIEAYFAVLKSPNWNYSNPRVQETLRNVRDNVTSVNIKNNLESNYSKLLEFVKLQYQQTLK